MSVSPPSNSSMVPSFSPIFLLFFSPFSAHPLLHKRLNVTNNGVFFSTFQDLFQKKTNAIERNSRLYISFHPLTFKYVLIPYFCFFLCLLEKILLIRKRKYVTIRRKPNRFLSQEQRIHCMQNIVSSSPKLKKLFRVHWFLSTQWAWGKTVHSKKCISNKNW